MSNNLPGFFALLFWAAFGVGKREYVFGIADTEAGGAEVNGLAGQYPLSREYGVTLSYPEISKPAQLGE